MPEISVVVPVYNTEKYLKKCLDSICKQTLSDIEIICVDDCSSDNSSVILQEFAGKDRRIKVINHTVNQGVSISRNEGIKIACGNYIGFADSDDYLKEDFFEKLYQKAKQTGCDIVKGNIYNYYSNTGEIVLTDFYDRNDKIKNDKTYFYYGFTSAIYRRNFIQKNNILFPENINYFEDPYFSIKACINCKSIDFASDAIYYYTKHLENISNTSDSKIIETDFIKALEVILELINNSNITEKEYLIIFDFLHGFLMEKIYDVELSDSVRKTLVDEMAELINKCRVKNTYFQETLKRLPREYMFRLMKGNIKVNA